MRTSYVIASACLLAAACVPKVTEHIPCTTNAQCAEWPGLLCDTQKSICVCDGTATYPGCANSMDARPAGPEVLMPTDGLRTDLDQATDGDADAAPTPDAADAAAPDTTIPDTAIPDTKPIQCTTSSQCSGTAPICTSNVCAACTSASQCLAKDPTSPACATTGAAAGQCVQCTDDSPCRSKTATPVCSTVKNTCVECTSGANCQGAARACDLTKNQCVECTDNSTCSGSTPICITSTNKCSACTAPGQCLAKDPTNPACATTGTAAGQCVQCTDDSTCKSTPGTPACNTASNKCVACTTSGNCSLATPICDTSVNKCMACAASNECAGLADPKRAVCAPSGTCVQCTKNADCSGNTPLCDVSANKCIPCTASTQCAALSDAKRAVCSTTGACVECTDNSACGGNTPICDTTTNKCTACKASNQCTALSDAKRAVCNLTSGACVECTASTSCGGNTPICNTGTNKCTACSTSTECAGLGDASRATCASSSGACVQCTSNTNCSGVAGAPYCETSTNKCVECLTSTNCSGTKPICSSTLCGACKSDDECGAKDSSKKACASTGTSAGACVQCTSNSHCGASTPICDTSSNTCRACTGDNECTGMGPGVCMKHQDGRCASDAETVVATSTSTLPSSLASGKRLVIIRGAVSGTVAWNLPTSQLTIIGQNTGVLTGNGSAATMHLTGGDFYMRDLSITGGAPGLWADGGAIARLDHVSVSNNTAGGILLDGAGFDIRNTTINGNGANTAGGAAFGGIRIQSPPATPRVFTLSTVNENQLIGVSCDASSSLNPLPTTILVSQPTGVPIATVCGFTSCAAASSSCGAQ